jgi:hypothetical protein
MIEYTVEVYDTGTKYWYMNGKRHREDGPAIERANGDKYWYLKGKLSREDGPAIEWADGYKAWYLNGVQLTQEEWERRLKKPCNGKVVVEYEGVKYKLEEV